MPAARTVPGQQPTLHAEDTSLAIRTLSATPQLLHRLRRCPFLLQQPASSALMGLLTSPQVLQPQAPHLCWGIAALVC